MGIGGVEGEMDGGLWWVRVTRVEGKGEEWFQDGEVCRVDGLGWK